jgi:hypothetical protein
MTRSRHFVIARAMLGAYVLVHFAMLVPYAAELVSNQGMLPDASASPLSRAFPGLLSLYDTPFAATALVALGALSGATLLGSFWPRTSALVAYYVWASVFTRNPLILNPSLPYVGLMLLACAAVRKDATDEELRRWSRLLWIAMALGYTYSGLTKLTSPSWLDGSALTALLQNPLARPTALRDLLIALPPALLACASWGTLALELLFAPLALVPRARPLLWAGMLALHLTLIVLVQFSDLSLGMALLHVLTFDIGWRARRTDPPPTDMIAPTLVDGWRDGCLRSAQ